MSKVISNRERFADRVFLVLQLLSRLLFVLLGILGIILSNYYFAIGGIILGFMIGRWIRYSLGINKKIEFGGYYIDGFYKRINERANGSSRRLLEYAIEKLRGNEFSPGKCSRISKIYDEFKQKSRLAKSEEEMICLLVELDNKTKEISYERK